MSKPYSTTCLSDIDECTYPECDCPIAWNDPDEAIEVEPIDRTKVKYSMVEILAQALKGEQVIVSGKRKVIMDAWMPEGSRQAATLAFDDGTTTRIYLPTVLTFYIPETEADNEDIDFGDYSDDIASKLPSAIFALGAFITILLLLWLRLC